MLNRQTQSTQNNAQPSKSTKSYQNQHCQHGQHISYILLGVPSETLTGITSYLDPPSLLSLARVNNLLYEHVANDNTWHRAFVCQFLKIGPECDIRGGDKSLMLRRSESSWRNEFIVRYNLKRRWERSRNATVTHIPVHSPISGMHIMPGHGLLAASIQYGIVSRSFPLTGKILSGYLDASGIRAGLGIGNPNAEFTPNVSACALASDGGTAKVLWGFRNGKVAVMTAGKAMDTNRRAAAELVQCAVNDEHEGAVLDALWDDESGATAVTGGADGRLKVWDVKKVRCIWTSEKRAGALVSDACVRVAATMSKGYVAGAMRSGNIVLWTGFNAQPLDAFSATSVNAIWIPCPALSSGDGSDVLTREVTMLCIDPYASTTTLLVAYRNDPYFYRVCIAKATNSITITTLGDASSGSVSSIAPFFGVESSFVIAGDHIGYISIYDWSAPQASIVHPVRKFEAHQDGSSITALAWNGMTLITGSARGDTHVWDALTFEHLRSFASPVPRIRRRAAGEGREKEAVAHIMVGPEKEDFMVSVGDRVLAWRAGPVVRGASDGVRGRHAMGESGKKRRDRNGAAKYFQQLEMQQIILESTKLLKQETEQVQRANGREREQRERLEKMGLDEVEAVEYLLMLSRDEASANAVGLENMTDTTGDRSTALEEDVFDEAFDDIADTNQAIASASSSTIDIPPLSLPSRSCSGMNVNQQSKPVPQITRSMSSQKVRADPPIAAEAPMVWSDPMLMRTSPPKDAPIPDQIQFPPIGASTSLPTPATVDAGMINRAAINAGRSGASSLSGHSFPNQAIPPLSGCPHSVSPVPTTAWSKPLVKSTANNPGWPLPAVDRRSQSSQSFVSGESSVTGRGTSKTDIEDMDKELRFAIELSLAEARSRGEDV